MGILHGNHTVTDEVNNSIRSELSSSYSDGCRPDERLQFLEKLLRFTGLTFREFSGEGKISKPRLLLAIFIMIVSSYQSIYSVYIILFFGHDSTVVNLVNCVASVQCYMSEIFIVYWQFGGGFQRIYSAPVWSYSHLRPQTTIRSRTVCAYIIFGILYALFCVISTIVDTVSYYKNRYVLVNGIPPAYYWVSVLIACLL